MTTFWTHQEAVELAARIEEIAPKFGAHVALTGGCLYKAFSPATLRKDCDIVLYRIRQAMLIDTIGLWAALKEIGIEEVSGFGWCHKATYQGKNIDIFFPEEKAKTEAAPTRATPASDREY